MMITMLDVNTYQDAIIMMQMKLMMMIGMSRIMRVSTEDYFENMLLKT